MTQVMKKSKLFAAVMAVALCVCMMAVSVSAAIPSYTYSNGGDDYFFYDGSAAPHGQDLIAGYEVVDGDTILYMRTISVKAGAMPVAVNTELGAFYVDIMDGEDLESVKNAYTAYAESARIATGVNDDYGNEIIITGYVTIEGMTDADAVLELPVAFTTGEGNHYNNAQYVDMELSYTAN